jgi:hypothetical protein
MMLEYALNKEYGGTFRKPLAISDIYISNLGHSATGFLFGQTQSSAVGKTQSSTKKSSTNRIVCNIGSSFTFIYVIHFQINVPRTLVDVSIQTNMAMMRSFVNRYIPFSINFTIINI